MITIKLDEEKGDELAGALKAAAEGRTLNASERELVQSVYRKFKYDDVKIVVEDD